MFNALRPIHKGAITSSIAALTAGIAVKPNASPQPIIPPSVVTLTSRESALLAFFFPQADSADLPPPANGMLTTITCSQSSYLGQQSPGQVAPKLSIVLVSDV